MEVLVLEYGIEVVILAVVSILLVGLMKVLFKGQLEKIEKTNRKPLYEVASILIVTLLSVVWILISGGAGFEMYVAKILASYGAMKVMYPLYENFKIRDLVQMLGKLLKEHKDSD